MLGLAGMRGSENKVKMVLYRLAITPNKSGHKPVLPQAAEKRFPDKTRCFIHATFQKGVFQQLLTWETQRECAPFFQQSAKEHPVHLTQIKLVGFKSFV